MKTSSKNIFCSVSAGYSSVMMAVKLKEWYPDHNIINVMANTSKERKESLQFMNECDKYFGLNLIWIESVFNEEVGVGVYFIIKNYDDLLIDGEIYEQGIKKFGIPSVVNKWCNRDLKYNPMTKFIKTVFGDDYSVAIGIRSDEMDRVSKNYFQNNIFYPLLDNGIDSRYRNKFWDDQPIQIKIPSHKGNCDLCFKKSKRKILTILNDEPEVGNWWKDMENKYSHIEIEGKPIYNSFIEKDGGHYFFRGNINTEQMLEESKGKFRKQEDEYIYENDLFDFEDDCGSGCIVFD